MISKSIALLGLLITLVSSIAQAGLCVPLRDTLLLDDAPQGATIVFQSEYEMNKAGKIDELGLFSASASDVMLLAWLAPQLTRLNGREIFPTFIPAGTELKLLSTHPGYDDNSIYLEKNKFIGTGLGDTKIGAITIHSLRNRPISTFTLGDLRKVLGNSVEIYRAGDWDAKTCSACY